MKWKTKRKMKMMSILLGMWMILTAVFQGKPFTVWADNDGAAAVQGDNPAPAVAVYINGTWCNVQPLSGKSGEVWLSVPIPGELLVNSRDNYVRVTSNVANGTAEEEQLRLYLSDSSWSNSFLSEQIWVDDNWTGYTDKQANLYIEGWDGSQWRRIHDDIDAYTTDHASPLGRNSGGSYTNFARNIWVGENVVENYEAFRVRIHTYVGSSLATHMENVALFPAENYRNCDLCDSCGGCKSENCSLSHRRCSCNPAVRVRVGGTGIEASQWYGWYIEEKSLDQQWVSIPVSMEGLTAGEQYQVAVSSNVNSNGNLDESSLDLYATNSSEGLESFVTGDQYCDGGWSQYSDRNINVKLEGWNGHEWVDLNAAKPVYSTDADTTVLGQFAGDTWYNACRNIILGSMEGVTAVRVSMQLHVGEHTRRISGYEESSFALFLPAQEVEQHEMCDQHPGYCTREGCPFQCMNPHDTLEFLGGSLRMDVTDDQGNVDYSRTSLRFGYRMKLPEGAELISWKWAFSLNGDKENLTKSLSGEKKTIQKDGSIISNLVITDIPSRYYDREIYAKLTVIYKLGDKTITVTEQTVQNRSVKTVAEKIIQSNGTTEKELAEQAYARGLLDTQKP